MRATAGATARIARRSNFDTEQYWERSGATLWKNLTVVKEEREAKKLVRLCAIAAAVLRKTDSWIESLAREADLRTTTWSRA